jgi:hypothetical protein
MRVTADTTFEEVNTWTPVERFVLEYQRESWWQASVAAFFPANLGFYFYHTLNSRGSNEGFPDCHVWHPRSGITLVAELKLESPRRSKVTMAQYDYLQAAVACGAEAFVWRPSEGDEIRHIVQNIIEAGWPTKT